MKTNRWSTLFWGCCLMAVMATGMIVFVMLPVRSVEASSALQVVTIDLGITKSDGTTSVDAGGSTVYTIRVTNNGPDSVTGAILTDAVATGLNKTAVACSSTPGQCVTPPTKAELEGGSFALPALASGEFYQIRVDADVTATSGSVTNTATIDVPSGYSDSDGTNDSADDTDSVTPVADLQISKSDGTTSVVAYGSTTYTIRVTNNGPSSVTGAILTDAAAADLDKTAVACSSTPGKCVTPPSVAGLEGGSFALPALADGEFYEITVDANATAASGTVTNTATSDVPGGTTDDDNTNNSADDTDNVTPFTATPTVTNTPTMTATPRVNELDVEIIVENDANDDGDYNSTETVYKKSVTVDYKITIKNEDNEYLWFDTIEEINEGISVRGTCDNLVSEGKKIAKNESKTCTFSHEWDKSDLPVTIKIRVIMRDNVSPYSYGWDTDTSKVLYSSKTATPTKTTYHYYYYTSTPYRTSTRTATFDFSLRSATPSSTSAFVSTRTPTPVTPTSTKVQTATLRGGLSMLQMTGTSASSELETVAALEEQEGQTSASTSNFNPRLLLWCLFPAVLLLLVGSGLELFRWINTPK